MTRTISTYITGFVLSFALTLAAPLLLWWHDATHHSYPTHEMLYAAFVLLALGQLFVQLYFFLHIGDEQKPRWNLMALCFALLVVLILTGGTLWIMHNLAHSMDEQLPFIEGSITPQASND